MATKIEQTYRIDGSTTAVMDIMRNAEFVKESEKARDALTCEVVSKQEDDARHVFEIQSTTYARGATGIDRSKTETNKTPTESSTTPPAILSRSMFMMIEPVHMYAETSFERQRIFSGLTF